MTTVLNGSSFGAMIITKSDWEASHFDEELWEIMMHIFVNSPENENFLCTM